MFNFQLVRMLGKSGEILSCEVHRAVESFPESVSQRVTLLSQPVMSVSELVMVNCLHSHQQYFIGEFSMIPCRCL